MATVATGKRPGWRTTAGGEYLAEFLGTFVLIMFGDGVVAMVVAGLPSSGRTVTPITLWTGVGDWLLIVWGWAFAVMFGVYTAGGISGAHINPAVTLAFALRRGFSWAKVPGYWIAQVAGAFVAAALVYVVYKAAIYSFLTHTHATKKTSLGTYSIFATFPAGYFHTVWGPLIDQVVGTGLLVFGVFAIVDEFNIPPAGNLGPLLIGLLVGAIGASFGANAGYAINPARDFGPRLFAWIAGWGKLALPGDYKTLVPATAGNGSLNTYFWIPIVGPLVGAAIACYIYDFGIRDILVARGTTPEPGEERGEVLRETPGGEQRGEARRDTPRETDELE